MEWVWRQGQGGRDHRRSGQRETFEEAGIVVGETEEVGLIDFEFKGNPEILEVHIFGQTNFRERRQKVKK